MGVRCSLACLIACCCGILACLCVLLGVGVFPVAGACAVFVNNIAVAASGTMLGEAAAQTAIIVKSSQNVLLGLAAFVISLMWTYKGEQHEEKPTIGVIWDRFPKFVVGFVLASLVFSFMMDTADAKAIGKITKGFTNTLFSIAFVCVGLETRFADIFSKENRRPLWAFLTAQGVNIIVTLVVAYLLFGVVKPLFA